MFFSIIFRSVFSSISAHFLGPFWEPKSAKIASEIRSKIESFFNHLFWCLGGSGGRPGSQNVCLFIVFIRVFAFPLFLDFDPPRDQNGAQRGARREPKVLQKVIKNRSENHQKIDEFLARFLVPFGSQRAPERLRINFSSRCLLPGGSLGSPGGSILSSFWDDFGPIFDRFFLNIF